MGKNNSVPFHSQPDRGKMATCKNVDDFLDYSDGELKEIVRDIEQYEKEEEDA